MIGGCLVFSTLLSSLQEPLNRLGGFCVIMMLMETEADRLWVEARLERLRRYESFDKLVDLALDKVITMEEAVLSYRNQYGLEVSSGEV